MWAYGNLYSAVALEDLRGFHMCDLVYWFQEPRKHCCNRFGACSDFLQTNQDKNINIRLWLTSSVFTEFQCSVCMFIFAQRALKSSYLWFFFSRLWGIINYFWNTKYSISDLPKPTIIKTNHQTKTSSSSHTTESAPSPVEVVYKMINIKFITVTTKLGRMKNINIF